MQLLCARVAAEVSPEDYAILTAVLKHGFGDECQEIVIEEKSSGGSIALNTDERPMPAMAELLGIRVELLLQWEKNNQGYEFLEEKFELPCDYHLFSAEQRSTIFSAGDSANADEPNGESLSPENGWQNFKKTFPESVGIIRLAKPAIDNINKEALAYVEFDCGPSCGSGRFVLLDKNVEDKWRVSGGSLVWMATE